MSKVMAMGYGLWVMGYGLWVMECRYQVADKYLRY